MTYRVAKKICSWPSAVAGKGGKMKRKDLVLVALVGFSAAFLGAFVGRGGSDLGVEKYPMEEFGDRAYAEQVQKSEVRSQESEVRDQKSEVRSQMSDVRKQKSEDRSSERIPPSQTAKKMDKGKGKSPGNIILDAGAGYTVIGASNDDGNDGKLKLHAEQGATDYSVTFQPSDLAMSADVTYKLPAAYATANDQVLTGSTAGVLSWTDKGGVGYTENCIKTCPLLANGKTTSAGATVWAWGAWVELLASTGANDIIITGVSCYVYNPLYEYILEIGVGASGSESAVIQLDVSQSHVNVTAGHKQIRWSLSVPRKIPAGSRIAVRSANNNISNLGARWVKIQYVEL